MYPRDSSGSDVSWPANDPAHRTRRPDISKKESCQSDSAIGSSFFTSDNEMSSLEFEDVSAAEDDTEYESVSTLSTLHAPSLGNSGSSGLIAPPMELCPDAGVLVSLMVQFVCLTQFETLVAPLF